MLRAEGAVAGANRTVNEFLNFVTSMVRNWCRVARNGGSGGSIIFSLRITVVCDDGKLVWGNDGYLLFIYLILTMVREQTTR